jgi:hypothetical protein
MHVIIYVSLVEPSNMSRTVIKVEKDFKDADTFDGDLISASVVFKRFLNTWRRETYLEYEGNNLLYSNIVAIKTNGI